MSKYSVSLSDISNREHTIIGDGLILPDNYQSVHNYLTEQERHNIVSYLRERIKRGDIVHLKEYDGDRNDGKMIYDGISLLDLYHGIDEYGSIPSCFFVGDEFLADHWLESIEHNSIVWINPIKHRKELMANFGKKSTFFDAELGEFVIHVVSEDDADLQGYIDTLKGLIQKDNPIPLSTCCQFVTRKPNPYIMYYRDY